MPIASGRSSSGDGAHRVIDESSAASLVRVCPRTGNCHSHTGYRISSERSRKDHRRPTWSKSKIGTGFIVRLEKDLVYIMTAAHVVSGDAQPRVQFFPQVDVSVQATVRHSEGDDAVTGLALLVVRGKNNLPSGLTVLTLASTSSLTGNEEILVIGHPRGAGDWAILKGGIASRQGRYITVDANIDEGNSGGPIIHSGEVVGLVGGVTRYGRGVTAGSVRECLERHGIDTRTAPPAAVAKVQPTPSIPIKPEKSGPAFEREITGKDGAPMVLIPVGQFWMGSPDGEGDKDEHASLGLFGRVRHG